MIRKSLFIVFIAALVSGCGGALKEGWTDFTTYYNTYYNANQYFEEGQKSVQDQQITLNPESPVRIYPSPISAGNESLEKAVEKCALVIQKHSDSQWVDDALLLMGKSHYYLGEFITAINRFEQLDALDADTSLTQQAVIWKGRALFDLGEYGRGIAYLEPMLETYPRGWSREVKGEMQALVGQYYAMQEDWEEASTYLSQALSNISDRALLGRTYFLYGQMLEREERLGEAQYAYEQVPSYFPGTEYVYWSNVKQADVARQQGNLETALRIYQQLRNNDKYFERRNQLTFHIAHTLQVQGKVEAAEQRYQELLYGEERSGQRRLQADIYYQMGKIYNDQYQDFAAATAYFDTSASLRSEESTSEITTYRQYADLQVSVARADSLLWLGSLTPVERDSVLERLRRKEQQRLLETRQEREENSLRNEPAPRQPLGDVPESTMYGFLNHRNQTVLNRDKKEFRLLWGNRPLVDNWRRQEALNQSYARNNRNDPAAALEEQAGNSQVIEAGVSLEEAIPKTEEARLQLQRERIQAQYQLGNLLHLNMDKPDSAKIYYYKVVNTPIDDGVRAKAMYALHDLFQAKSQVDSVCYWKKRLIDEFPNSEYVRLVTADESRSRQAATDSIQMFNKYHAINDTADMLSKGGGLRSLALEHKGSALAPHIHFKAIEVYIQKAQFYRQLQEMLVGGDTLATIELNSGLLFTNNEEYTSIHWDSVRTVLAEHDHLFTEGPYQARIAPLQQAVGQSAGSSSDHPLPTCRDRDISLAVEPDMETFLHSVDWPESMDDKRLSGEITYTFVIDAEGNIDSFNLESPRTSLGIEEALEKAFERSLHFAPPNTGEEIDQLRCEVRFPIGR